MPPNRAALPQAAPASLPAPEPPARLPDTPPHEPLSRFDIAAARARARYTAEEWVVLDPAKRSTAIYAELRRIDGTLSR